MAKKNEAVTSGPYQAPVTVRVLEGNTIIHDDETYTDGDVVELPARTADHLILAGHVEVVTDE
jgi:hypothetical protein